MIKGIMSSSGHSPVRKVNQDYLFSSTQSSLFIVSDFFGATSHYEIAKTLTSYMEENLNQLVNDPEKTQPFYFNNEFSVHTNSLVNSLMSFNTQLYQLNTGRPVKDRSGVSILSMFIKENKASIVNIGTCEAVLIRDSKIFKLASSQNLFFDASSIVIPRNFIGKSESFLFDVVEQNIQDNDKVILLTDGVAQNVTTEEIQRIYSESINDQGFLEALLDKDSRVQDNKSILIVSC